MRNGGKKEKTGIRECDCRCSRGMRCRANKEVKQTGDIHPKGEALPKGRHVLVSAKEHGDGRRYITCDERKHDRFRMFLVNFGIFTGLGRVMQCGCTSHDE